MEPNEHNIFKLMDRPSLNGYFGIKAKQSDEKHYKNKKIYYTINSVKCQNGSSLSKAR